MAFEDLELQVSPLTKQIYLGTLSLDRTKFVGKKKDMTNEVLSAVIQKVGIDTPMSIGVNGVEKYRIVIMEVKPIKGPVEKKVTIKTLADSMGTSVTPRIGPLLKSTPALSKVCGKGPMYRSEVVTKLWEYIKRKKLQDPLSKRMINCDDNLRNVFEKNRVSMFEMASLIGKHLTKVE